jgi:trans-feruloyl-CoA hydratase/vanillin synthase
MSVKTDYETILVETDNGITTVKFNRPEKRNAMSPQLHQDMYDVLRDLEFDDDTKVLIITGNGEAFCAGQDLKEYFFEQKDNHRAREESRRLSHAWRHQLLYYFPKPTIAMVNGYCFGGAFTTVASCDIAIAADEATFGLSEVNFGHLAGGIVSKVVADLMLPRQALYYLMTGEPFDGKRATEIGFVTLSVPKAQLLSRTLALAETLKAKNPHGLRACKDAVKAVAIRNLSYEDSWQWLTARSEQLRLAQKDKNWIEHGIGKFVEKAYRPGREAAPQD